MLANTLNNPRTPARFQNEDALAAYMRTTQTAELIDLCLRNYRNNPPVCSARCRHRSGEECRTLLLGAYQTRARMPTTSLNGQSLHYTESGHGEFLLLIHGLGSSGADWGLQIPALEGHCRVIVPDLPGSGRSAPPLSGYSIAGFAQSLWSLLDQFGATSVNIAGFSLGGAVALEMVLQRPACVRRLALINSLATYRLENWCKWLEAWIPLALVPLIGMRRMARLAARRLFPHPWQGPLRERAAAVMGAVPAATYLGMGRALLRWTASDRIQPLTADQRAYPGGPSNGRFARCRHRFASANPHRWWAEGSGPTRCPPAC